MHSVFNCLVFALPPEHELIWHLYAGFVYAVPCSQYVCEMHVRPLTSSWHVIELKSLTVCRPKLNMAHMPLGQ